LKFGPPDIDPMAPTSLDVIAHFN